MSFEFENLKALAENPNMVACYVGLAGWRAEDHGWGEFMGCPKYERAPIMARHLLRDPAGVWTITCPVIFGVGEGGWGAPSHYLIFFRPTGGVPAVIEQVVNELDMRPDAPLTRLKAGNTATLAPGSLRWT